MSSSSTAKLWHSTLKNPFSGVMSFVFEMLLRNPEKIWDSSSLLTMFAISQHHKTTIHVLGKSFHGLISVYTILLSVTGLV